MRTIGRSGRAFAAALLAGALAAAGCVKGVGDPCRFQSDCEPGLQCTAGACATCGNGVECLSVDLVVRGCAAEADPLLGVGLVRATLTGADVPTPVVDTAIAGAGQLRLKSLPLCKSCVLLVEGLVSDTDATVLSRGQSAPFDLNPTSPPPAVTVFLRRTGAFTPANSRTAPGACSALKNGRAGHTATALPDGRVLVAGGYTLDAAGCDTSPPSCFLQSTELWDPHTGTFVDGPALKRARWGHTATLLPDGRVLVTGGLGMINQKPTPLQVGEVWSPSSNAWSFVSMKSQRYRHAAAVLPNGVVLLSGGFLSVDGTALNTTEVLDPRGAQFVDGPTLAEKRADHASLAVAADAGGERILVAGGVGNSTGTQVVSNSTVEVLHWSGGTEFTRDSTTSLKLVTGGRAAPRAFAMTVLDSYGALVVGPSAGGHTGPEDAWDWLILSGSAPPRDVKAFPTARKDFCAASFDGGVLVAGGRDAGASAAPLATVDTYIMQANGKLQSDRLSPGLSQARFRAACATLADGTVLVVGGEAAGGETKTSGAADFYQPN